MSFKDNLLKKININLTAKKVISSIGPPGSERKTDKTTMRLLLEMSPYSLHKKRDLDLYIKGDPEKKGQILVLDGDPQPLVCAFGYGGHHHGTNHSPVGANGPDIPLQFGTCMGRNTPGVVLKPAPDIYFGIGIGVFTRCGHGNRL